MQRRHFGVCQGAHVHVQYERRAHATSITMQQASSFDADFGWIVWDVRAAGTLLYQHSAHLRALSVLELGAGALMAARFCHVVLTDFFAPVLDNLRRNAAAQRADCVAAVCVEPLDWRQCAESLARSADLVVGADIVYEAVHTQLVPRAAAHVCASRGAVVLCLQTNHEGVCDITRAMCAAGFVGGAVAATQLLRGRVPSHRVPSVIACYVRAESVGDGDGGSSAEEGAVGFRRALALQLRTAELSGSDSVGV